MSHWATSSRAPSGSRAGVLAAAVLLAAAAAGPAAGTTLMTADEALALAYPDCQVERRTAYLTAEQRDEAERLSGGEVRSAVVHPYPVRCGGRAAGTAYFDVHRVRTLEETLMVALDAEGRVLRVEVLSFREPREYLPRDLWYRQFDGEALSPGLDLERDVRGVTGATLTARATTAAVRRVLALHRVLAGAAAKEARK
jgi:hypothetical protein